MKFNRDEYEDWYVGLVGFCATFGADFFNGGFARGWKNDKVTPRDMPNEAIRNILKQQPNLSDIKFICKDFRKIKDITNHVIYCDPPYRNSVGYRNLDKFPYEEFYEWCRYMSKNNIVLISEYNMPDDFECIWQKESKVNIDFKRKTRNHNKNRVEKLFIKSNNVIDKK